MITITLNRYGKKESMEISPCYEKVLLTLWKLGLDRDPEKYTLKELGAIFTCETPEEHQMVRIISTNDTLMDALLALMRMRDQPELILESIEPAIQKGHCCSTSHLDAIIDQAITVPAIGVISEAPNIATSAWALNARLDNNSFVVVAE